MPHIWVRKEPHNDNRGILFFDYYRCPNSFGVCVGQNLNRMPKIALFPHPVKDWKEQNEKIVDGGSSDVVDDYRCS